MASSSSTFTKSSHTQLGTPSLSVTTDLLIVMGLKKEDAEALIKLYEEKEKNIKPYLESAKHLSLSFTCDIRNILTSDNVAGLLGFNSLLPASVSTQPYSQIFASGHLVQYSPARYGPKSTFLQKKWQNIENDFLNAKNNASIYFKEIASSYGFKRYACTETGNAVIRELAELTRRHILLHHLWKKLTRKDNGDYEYENNEIYDENRRIKWDRLFPSLFPSLTVENNAEQDRISSDKTWQKQVDTIMNSQISQSATLITRPGINSPVFQPSPPSSDTSFSVSESDPHASLKDSSPSTEKKRCIIM